MAADPRFDFYENVIIDSTDPALSEVNGELGTVLGRACDEEYRWSYAVSVYRTGVCWSCMEDDLCRTGEDEKPPERLPSSPESPIMLS